MSRSARDPKYIRFALIGRWQPESNYYDAWGCGLVRSSTGAGGFRKPVAQVAGNTLAQTISPAMTGAEAP